MNPLWNVSYCEDIFGEKKLLILIYNLPMFSFIVGIFYLRSLCIFQPRSWRCSSVFSSKIFFVLPFTFKSEILLNLFLLIGFKVEVFSYGFPVVPALFIEKNHPSLNDTSFPPLSCKRWSYMCEFVSGLYSVSLISLFFLVPVPHHFNCIFIMDLINNRIQG